MDTNKTYTAAIINEEKVEHLCPKIGLMASFLHNSMMMSKEMSLVITMNFLTNFKSLARDVFLGERIKPNVRTILTFMYNNDILTVSEMAKYAEVSEEQVITYFTGNTGKVCV